MGCWSAVSLTSSKTLRHHHKQRHHHMVILFVITTLLHIALFINVVNCFRGGGISVMLMQHPPSSSSLTTKNKASLDPFHSSYRDDVDAVARRINSPVSQSREADHRCISGASSTQSTVLNWPYFVSPSGSRRGFLATVAATTVAVTSTGISAGGRGSAGETKPMDGPSAMADGGGHLRGQARGGLDLEDISSMLIPPAFADDGEVNNGDGQQETVTQSFLSGAVSGAAVRITKQLVLHPVETIKSRLQYSKKSRKITPELFSRLYDGVLPPLVVGIPAGSAFFAIKDSIQTIFADVGSNFRLSKSATTVLAVAVANVPYWAILTPAEVIKTRQQTGVVKGQAWEEATRIVKDEGGATALYAGYRSNLAYAFPADAIKFLVYDSLKQNALVKSGGKKVSTLESGVLGALASMAAQAASTPLDVVRTRLMCQDAKQEQRTNVSVAERYTGITDAFGRITQEEGIGALFAGISPRLARSVLSGAIQFISYEGVKNQFGGAR